MSRSREKLIVSTATAVLERAANTKPGEHHLSVTFDGSARGARLAIKELASEIRKYAPVEFIPLPVPRAGCVVADGTDVVRYLAEYRIWEDRTYHRLDTRFKVKR